jgi:antitoxin (DNA-binding transcriptional repressor) of toxin-antitoxin stability system
MTAFRVAEARARFGDLLDEAESGGTVVIERRGVRFLLAPEAPSTAPARSRGRLAYVHPDVESGTWTWASSARGLRFRPRRTRP